MRKRLISVYIIAILACSIFGCGDQDTTYSPDGKYLAYYTGNFELDELWTLISDDESKLNKIYRMYDEWVRIHAR